MTHSISSVPRWTLPSAALATLLLAGCSSGHVGESWQCPLADAGTCDSVAAADPAVPDMEAARHTVLEESLWRVRNTLPPSPAVEAPCDAACDGGFDPFAWLARQFAPETVDREKAATTGPVRFLPPEAPTAATLPAAPEAAELHPVAEDPPGADLRTDEVVARIWIAPFVDADGVYREASWVRAVLEPAGWRLAR